MRARRRAARESEANWDNAYSTCERCRGRTLFLAMEVIGQPQPHSMVTRSICSECSSSFRQWWAAGAEAAGKA